MRITEWPAGERPRERLLEEGCGALSDAELLALVLRTSGVPGITSVERARQLLAELGGIGALHRTTAAELGKQRGLGLASAAAVLAALELGRRAACLRTDRGGVFRTSADVYAHFRGRLAPLRTEAFHVLLLDAQHRKLREVRISEGSLTASIVHPREVFVPAVRDSAAAMILVHNHPSGDPTPSSEDVELTRRLRQAGDVLGIRVLDHVIVATDGHFSFVDAGRW